MIIELSQEQALEAKKAIGYAIGKIRQKMRWMERHAHTHTHTHTHTPEFDNPRDAGIYAKRAARVERLESLLTFFGDWQ